MISSPRWPREVSGPPADVVSAIGVSHRSNAGDLFLDRAGHIQLYLRFEIGFGGKASPPLLTRMAGRRFFSPLMRFADAAKNASIGNKLLAR